MYRSEFRDQLERILQRLKKLEEDALKDPVTAAWAPAVYYQRRMMELLLKQVEDLKGHHTNRG
jgi:hypothetical protein